MKTCEQPVVTHRKAIPEWTRHGLVERIETVRSRCSKVAETHAQLVLGGLPLASWFLCYDCADTKDHWHRSSGTGRLRFIPL